MGGRGVGRCGERRGAYFGSGSWLLLVVEVRRR